MITVDTRGTTAYSPLIPAIKAMCNAVPGETLEIIMNHADAFQDLKEYLSEQSIGFREIYDNIPPGTRPISTFSNLYPRRLSSMLRL